MNRERMTILRNYLRDNVKDERFNLGTWVGNEDIPWGGMQDLSCGTTACAMGHAASVPAFQAQGLHLERFNDRYNQHIGRITFNGKVDFDAAAAFMDISIEDAEYLFDPERYPNDEATSRLEVVDRLTEALNDPYQTHYGYDEDEDENGELA